MMIRAARGHDIERLVALLSSKMSAKITPDRWRRLFDYPWRPNDSDFGRVAVDGNRIVGFVGMVYADRPIGGRPERIVNICAWYLDKQELAAWPRGYRQSLFGGAAPGPQARLRTGGALV